MDRDNYWDILKGLGIIAIVLGHIGTPIGSYLYMYHLSLFFFISGYLYEDKYTYKPIEFIINKCKRLLYPYLIYNIIFLILHNTFYNLHLYGNSDGVGKYNYFDFIHKFISIIALHGGEPLLGALWFVIALFTVNILFLITRIIDISIGKRYFHYISICLVFISFIIGYYIYYKKCNWFYHFNLDISLITLAVFYAGYLIKGKNINRYIHWIPAAISLFLLIFTCNNYGSIILAYRDRYLNNPLVFIVGSFTGIYVNLFLASIIKRYKHATNLLIYIGKRSLSIMALQFVAFKAVNLIYLLYNNESLSYLAKFPVITYKNNWWIAYLISGIIIPIGLDFLYDKLKEHYSTIIKYKLG